MQEMPDARATGPPNEIDVCTSRTAIDHCRHPDSTTVGVALIMVAFRTRLALGVRLSLRKPSRLLPGDRRFRHFARFHRNLLQAIDKPSAGGARR
jgi:hypothetical protein